MSATLEASLLILQSRKILKEVEPGSLPRQIMKIGGHNSLAGINVCVLSCCDGHQFMDITQHTFECCGVAKAAKQQELGLAGLGNDCFHWKTDNGGPFVLSHPELMVADYNGLPDYVDRSNLRAIQQAMHLKETNVVILIGHAVCGMMKPLVHTLDGYVSYMAAAKSRIMQEFGLPTEQVIAQLQCHRAEDKRRTYHVDYSEARALPIAA
jgi:hypothetical protein